MIKLDMKKKPLVDQSLYKKIEQTEKYSTEYTHTNEQDTYHSRYLNRSSSEPPSAFEQAFNNRKTPSDS